MEKDNEVKGIGNSLDFGARIYDSRTGKWLSLDPLAAKYPNTSPYVFVANNPLYYIDPDGRVIVISKAGNYDVAKSDILSIAGKHSAMFEVQKDGSVKANATRAQVEATGDAGAMLLYNVATSPNVYSYAADETANVRVANQSMKNGDWVVSNPRPAEGRDLKQGNAISNTSKQAYGWSKDNNGNDIASDVTEIPADQNVDAQIVINPNAGSVSELVMRRFCVG